MSFGQANVIITTNYTVIMAPLCWIIIAYRISINKNRWVSFPNTAKRPLLHAHITFEIFEHVEFYLHVLGEILGNLLPICPICWYTYIHSFIYTYKTYLPLLQIAISFVAAPRQGKDILTTGYLHSLQAGGACGSTVITMAFKNRNEYAIQLPTIDSGFRCYEFHQL